MPHIQFREHPTTPQEVSLLVCYYRSQPIYQELIALNQTCSMLHPDILAVIYHMARYATGPILEFGPYLGGSTVAMAWGMRDAPREGLVTSVEVGGAHLAHPMFPSKDILADLKANLERRGVADRASIISGYSRDAGVIAQVRRAMGNQRVAFFCVDTDGQIEADMNAYRDLLAPGAYLVVDDYYTTGAPDKMGPTSEGITRLEDAGVVESFGIFGWGSWVGRMR